MIFEQTALVLFVVRVGSDIIKRGSAQNNRTTFSTETRTGIKLEKLITVFSDLKNERVSKY